jgi:hypothetical protein
MEMTSNPPLAKTPSGFTSERNPGFIAPEYRSFRFDLNTGAIALKDCQVASVRPGFWSGTREGVVTTMIVITAALVFGGVVGHWFAVGEFGLFGQVLRIAGGTVVMASLVSLLGARLTGRDPIFWGIGMPLLVYVAGSYSAFISFGAGATAFLYGAPLFCGLAVLSGVMTAFMMDRGR